MSQDDSRKRAANSRRCYNMKGSIMEVIEETTKNYEGKFWNRHLQDFQSWEEQKGWYVRFQSFCNRMYLDYSDETSSPHATRFSQMEYEREYEDYLVKKFLETE